MQIPPPFKIKSVEPIRLLPAAERKKRLEKAGFNPFLLSASDVYIDLLTDSGTGAMSQSQWAGIMEGDESYAGSRNFENLQKAVHDIMGFPYVLPTHQGRGAEHVLDSILIKKGQAVPGNMHFDTTKAHIEHREGKAVDCTIEQAYDTSSDYEFKGNVDLKKLEKALKQYDVAYILVTVTCNSVGGQPVSLENIKQVSILAKKYKKLLFIDAARYAENAYFIMQRECKEKSVRQIVKEMFDYADGCLMSAKKDAIVNIGGFLAVRDKNLYKQLAPINVLFEGFPTYGGLAGRDMEAMARGLYEGIDEDYLRYRTGQVDELRIALANAGIKTVSPTGGHAVYVDAKKFFPHIPQENFPAHTLCVELYLEGGVRAVEIGTLLAGRDPETGKNIMPKLELTRLTIPRRVYTKEHIDYVAEVVKRVYNRRNSVKGLEFDYEAPILRHFQSTFKRLK